MIAEQDRSEATDPYRPPRFWVAGLLSLPLWGLIIGAFFSVALLAVLLATLVLVVAVVMPRRWHLVSDLLYVVALGIVIAGLALEFGVWD